VWNRINGTTSIAVWNKTESAASNTATTWSYLYDLAVGDYIECQYDHQGNVAKNVYGGDTTQTTFYCIYLGA